MSDVFTAESAISELKGPGSYEQWFYWRSKTPEQNQRSSVMKELEKLVETAVRLLISIT